ncbi:hypothetical protein [Vibrio cholerae]|nr:hypothetical protein [Vibrio cholerae]EGR0479223.1 hypothetical protein [Vibrio cholerae]EGR0508199.1 hypothetical protein [Vibrio cholerae]EJK2992694.1 hypothetical protein [Vibrio cholerae]EJL6905762.1 hypothetical protein [Vibrio cholerae]ELL0575679.1 hypothetical protein [Vibrio cholerae]
MNTFKKIIYCIILMMFSLQAVGGSIPSSSELRSLLRSYDIQTGNISETIAYIPIDKPCLNLLARSEHYEYCVINEGENLSNGDKEGFFITLDSVSESSVIFSYNTIWYSVNCLLSITDKKIKCDKAE